MKKRLIRRAFTGGCYFVGETIDMLNKFNPQFDKADTVFKNTIDKLNGLDKKAPTNFKVNELRELKDISYAIRNVINMLNNIAK